MKSLRIQPFVLLSIGFIGLVSGGIPMAQAAEELVPLNIKLPTAIPAGTRLDLETRPNLEPVMTNRPPFLAPKGIVNLAAGKKVTCSDAGVGADKLARIVDGDKSYESDSIVAVRKGTQWVQVDLGQESEIFAAVIWHAHDVLKVFHKVVMQVSDKEDFSEAVTLFNNDFDGSSGRGVGTDKEYYENHFGKLIDAKGTKGRYVRFYSKGSTESSLNEYTEIEIYGRAVK